MNWAVADQMARLVAGAGEGDGEATVAADGRLEAILRVAELELTAAGALDPAALGGPLGAVPVSREEWAARTLAGQRPLLSVLAAALALPGRAADVESADEELVDDELVSGARAGTDDPRGPLLAASTRGLVFGWMFGQLARRALGQYHLPLPPTHGNDLLLVPANLGEFAMEWRLAADDVCLWTCLREAATHSVLARPHVRSRLESLLVAYASAFEVDPTAFEAELEALDPSDPSSFQSVLGDPDAVLATVQTPTQERLVGQIDALTAAVAGWVDHLVAPLSQRLIGSADAIGEAARRRRVEVSWGERYAARLIGLGLRASSYERGTSFVAGVVERGGEEALARLWSSEATLPTPAELDAPGLWLARVELDDAGGVEPGV